MSYTFSTYRLYQASGLRKYAMSDEWLQCVIGAISFSSDLLDFFTPESYHFDVVHLEDMVMPVVWGLIIFGFWILGIATGVLPHS